MEVLGFALVRASPDSSCSSGLGGSWRAHPLQITLLYLRVHAIVFITGFASFLLLWVELQSA